MIKINLKTDIEDFRNDFRELLESFFPYVIQDDSSNDFVYINSHIENNKTTFAIIGFDIKLIDSVDNFTDKIINKKNCKWCVKNLLYKFLAKITNIDLPWGSLTGIRPTKLAREIGIDRLKNDFFVTDSKAVLLEDIIKKQSAIYEINDKNIDLYINIPFCVSRCSYCSFISSLYSQKKKLMPQFISSIKREILDSLRIIEENNYNLRSIYVGGGTPTSLEAEELKEVLSPLSYLKINEFTVEAGRPDTITREKLDVIRDVGATRISVNPQTFNQKTLDLIGRKHSVEDIYDKYALAREYHFTINMDLIASLPGETFDDFKYSIDECIKLKPDDITIHTLAIKRSAKLSNEGYDNSLGYAKQMIDYSRHSLYNAGYKPYYLYRQKHMSDNLENVGYTLDRPTIYNVDNMDEISSIIANGPGAISKKIIVNNSSQNDISIDRIANAKDIEEYLRRIDTIIKNKNSFFAKND